MTSPSDEGPGPEDLKRQIAALEGQLKRQYREGRYKMAEVIVMPLLLALLGWYIHHSLAQQSANLERELASIRDDREEIREKIDQSRLLSGLIKPLMSDNSTEQRLAIDIVLHACGESGRKLVEAIQLSDPKSATRDHAAESLRRRRDRLIEQLIAPEHQKRWDAAEELGAAWAGDREIVPLLLDFANRNRTNKLAVYNATTVFADLSAETFVGHEEAIRPFLLLAEKNGPKTANLVKEIRAKVSSLPEEGSY